MSKLSNKISLVLVVLVLAAAAFICFAVVPYISAANSMPEGVMTLKRLEDGALQLSWPEAEGADGYTLEVFVAAPSEGMEEQEVYSCSVESAECILPKELPEDIRLRFRVNSTEDYHMLWMRRSRIGDKPLEAKSSLETPVAEELVWTADANERTISLMWEGAEGNSYRIYHLGENDELTPIATQQETSAHFSFGRNGDLPMPDYGEHCMLLIDAYRESDGLVYYGLNSQLITVDRESMLGTVLELDCEDMGENEYTLTWNQTKGEGYEVQAIDPHTGLWETLARYEPWDELSYSTGHLEPFLDFDVRVVAVGGTPLAGFDYPAIPAETHIYTGASVKYATVWPLKDLELYSDTGKSESAGTAKAGVSCCVLEEKDGMFRVRSGENYGYIDSNYCMINLPDYIGELCAYDITNSYSSIYMVHEYAIPDVTATVVEGYENVMTESGQFLVPLLYPVAQRLSEAAKAVREDGYRLKIYDSFRPQCATRSIYDLTEKVLYEPLPKETYSKVTVDDLPDPPAGGKLRYIDLLSNGVYSLPNFLASRGSYHNMGIAVDLTLETLYGSEELEMQTSMHDLSWYSVLASNNDNAKLLDRYMKAAGFAGLTSEWWHFQDNELRDKLGLNIYLWNGVGPEGWKADDGGWRYRRADGSFYTDITLDIGSVKYTFDSNGYAEMKQ